MSQSGAYSVTFDLDGRNEESRRMALRALAETEKALVTNHDDPSPFIGLGEAHAILGNHEEAVDAARQALAMRPPSRHAWAAKVLQIDCIMRIYVRAGAFDDPIETLDEYLGTRGGCWSIEGLLPDPRLDPIRGDPRFEALVEKHRRGEYASE